MVGDLEDRPELSGAETPANLPDVSDVSASEPEDVEAILIVRRRTGMNNEYVACGIREFVRTR